MKKTTFSLSRILTVVITVILVSFAGAAKASDGKGNLPVDIKYLGNANESPVFQVNFHNEAEEEFYIVIRDNAHNILYSEKVKGKNISRKFQLVNEGLSDDEIHFEITNRKANTSVTYKTKNTTETINEVTVEEVK